MYLLKDDNRKSPTFLTSSGDERLSSSILKTVLQLLKRILSAVEKNFVGYGVHVLFLKENGQWKFICIFNVDWFDGHVGGCGI